MGIYLLHKPFLQQVIMPALSGIFPEDMPFFVTALIGSALAMLFAVAMCYIIGRFVPQLLGRFPRNEWTKTG